MEREVQTIATEFEGNPELMQFMKAALDLPPEVVRKVTTSFENGGGEHGAAEGSVVISIQPGHTNQIQYNLDNNVVTVLAADEAAVADGLMAAHNKGWL